MKNFIILVFVIIGTVLLAGLEYICGCPFEWPWGEFIGGVLLTLVLIVTNRTVGGWGYLYPLIPFSGRALLSLYIRRKKRS